MKQIIRVIDHPIKASIQIPGSKSITNRALLIAALADNTSEISGVLESEDTFALIQALRVLGIVIQFDTVTKVCTISGCAGEFPRKEAKIWCDRAGTVARFLLAACAGTPGKYHFDGEEQLRQRPILPLIKMLCTQGARVIPASADQLPLTVLGADALEGGEMIMDGSETGQFVSALLMAAPFAKNPVYIEAQDLVSKPFVQMTCDMMAEFGVRVKKLHHSRFFVPTPQRYAARDYSIEPDMATASYFFAAAALTGGQVTIQPVVRSASKQGDIEFLAVLEKMGCKVTEKESGLGVMGPSELKGVQVDMCDFSDTFMTLAAIAPFAKTPTSITNIGHTRLQESNRISVMHDQLKKLGAKVEQGPDWIKIYPSQLHGGEVDAHQDHRIAMAFSIIGLKIPGIVIDGAECVAKTCPDFFNMWEKLYT